MTKQHGAGKYQVMKHVKIISIEQLTLKNLVTSITKK